MSHQLKDTDPMPWGMHKGRPMQDVPAKYMHWLFTERGLDPNSPVLDYIKRNLHALKQEYPDGIWR